MARKDRGNISKPLKMSFIILIVMFVFFGILSLYGIHSLSRLTRTIYDHPLVVSNISLQATVSITKMHRSMKDAVLAKNLTELQSRIEAVNSEEQQVYLCLDVVEENILGREGRQLEKEARALVDAWKPIRAEVLRLIHSKQTSRAADITVGEGAIHVADLEAKMLELTRYARIKASQFMENTETVRNRVSISSLFCLVLGVIASLVVISVTLRRTYETEQELWESRQLLSNAIDLAPIGLILVGTDGRFVRVNQAFCAMIGYSEEELLQLKFQEVTHPDDHPMDEAMAEDQMGGNGTQGGIEKRYVAKDGCIVHVVLTTTLLRDDLGTPLYFLAQIQDVTDRKQEEKQLRQAQKMEAIGTLAGGIAHDFNNILGIILGNYELAVEDLSQGHPARLNLEEIKKASVRAKEVVGQLLSFSRDEEVEQKPVALDAVVKDSLVLLRSFIPGSIEIQQTLLTDSGIIMADASEIHQVLINLCMNAVHAMEDGGGLLTIVVSTVNLVDEPGFLGHGLGPGSYVKLRVKDSGHGIDSHIQGNVFDPYFTTRSVGKGSGMGLSVVHGIVINHGGAITIKGDPQGGTVVDILFPRMAGGVATHGTEHESARRGETVLVVDAEASLLIMVKQMLERLGYAVRAATSSGEALEAFSRDPDLFDLVITDIALPGTSGGRFSTEISSIVPDIPIIICTGDSSGMASESARDPGGMAYFRKPFDKHRLAIAVRNAIDRKDPSLDARPSQSV
ncbi:MAG: PAS domain S-box protein [Desulfobacterium sp.]|nr:PAS domain S-box protein [Desulfobacterium sp.]